MNFFFIIFIMYIFIKPILNSEKKLSMIYIALLLLTLIIVLVRCFRINCSVLFN